MSFKDLPSSACHISGGRSSSTTAMPTWLTGLLVSVWIARSAVERPRNSHRSPVRFIRTASSKSTVTISTLNGHADEVVEGPRPRGCRRRGGRRRHGGAGRAAAARVHPGRGAREAAGASWRRGRTKRDESRVTYQWHRGS